MIMEEPLAAFLKEEDRDEAFNLVIDAKYSMQRIINVTSGVDAVYAFRTDGMYACTKRGVFVLDKESYVEDLWPTPVLDLRGRALEYANGNGALRKIDNYPFISIERAFYDMNTQDRTGYLMILVSAKIIDQAISSLSESDICVMGLDGTFLSGDRNLVRVYDRSLAGDAVTHKPYIVRGQRVMISGVRVPDTPIIVISCIPLEGSPIPARTLAILAFLMGAMTVGLFVLGRFVSVNITKPINRLTKAMNIGESEKELVPISDKMPDNEIGLLKDSYNSMVIRIRNLIEELITKEQTIQRAEMRVLQEQIKPHFLYNSIGMISSLALRNGAGEVSSALETLGRFYRNFLSKGDKEIPLEREVLIVRDYLALQKLRYGEIIRDEYDIKDECLKCIVPKLILQPLVENSIYHGIRLKGEEGIIRISASIDDDNLLHIIVYDTGVGMSKEIADKLMSGIKNVSPDEESFGLWGTIVRLRYYFNRDNVVKIESEEGEYTRIEFIVPATTVPKAEEEDK
jgi:two-component system sensor histidine kinase YesM